MVDVSELLLRYPALEEVVWVQEEPQNMGAWEFVRPHLEKAIDGRAALRLVSRPASASPAEGSNNLHTHVQRQLVERAFGVLEPVHQASRLDERPATRVRAGGNNKGRAR